MKVFERSYHSSDKYLLNSHSALGNEPGPDVHRPPSHYLQGTQNNQAFQQMSPFQWKLPTHPLPADWAILLCDLIACCPYLPSTAHLYISVLYLASISFKGPNAGTTKVCMSPLPCEECPGSVGGGSWGLQRPGMGVGWREPGSPKLWVRSHASCSSPLILTPILWGKECLRHFCRWGN